MVRVVGRIKLRSNAQLSGVKNILNDLSYRHYTSFRVFGSVFDRGRTKITVIEKHGRLLYSLPSLFCEYRWQ